MTLRTFKGDYEQLNGITKRFQFLADAQQKQLTQLLDCLHTLEGGDWVGQGATQFYAEMNSSVIPSLKRLVHALHSAAQVTHHINLLIQQAERDTAAVLHDDTGPDQPHGSSGGRLYSPNKGTGTLPPAPNSNVSNGAPIGATGIIGGQTTSLPNLSGVQVGPLAGGVPPEVTVTFFDSNGKPITPTPVPTPAPVPTTQPTAQPTIEPTAPTSVPTATPATSTNTVGVEFTQPPVPMTGNTFVNGFGPIEFARDHWQGNYGRTSGLHGGIDLGVPGGTEVKAGVYGEVVEPGFNTDADFPGGHVIIKVGDKYVIYGHTEQSSNLKPGDRVTPDTVLGTTFHWDALNNYDYDNSHLHLAVLEQLPDGRWRTHNPALLFSPDAVLPSGITDTANGEAQMESFIYSGTANYWDHKNDAAIGIVWR